jgi:hypothetical protein
MDRIENHLLNAFVPCPGFSVFEMVDTGVGSEEWVEDTSLVLLDKLVVSGNSFEAWKICTRKNHT